MEFLCPQRGRRSSWIRVHPCVRLSDCEFRLPVPWLAPKLTSVPTGPLVGQNDVPFHSGHTPDTLSPRAPISRGAWGSSSVLQKNPSPLCITRFGSSRG